MPPSSRRRRLRDLPKTETGGSAVESALILGLTAAMVYSFKTMSGVATLIKPTQQAFAALIRALS
jgi:Flp pilus assembly pilin Flp